jgi:hypothetical protein
MDAAAKSNPAVETRILLPLSLPYSKADQIAMAIAIIAAQHSASRAIVSRIGHRHTLWPVIASMAFPPTRSDFPYNL